jgi:hypothetical protein
LLALFLAMPVVAFAQDGESEPDEDAAVDQEDEAADEAAEEAAEEAAPEPDPEPEVSAVDGETGDPAATQEEEEEEDWHPANSVAAEEQPSEGEGAEGEGEGAPAPPEGGGAGLRYDLETGRWVEDVEPLPWRNSLFVWNNSLSVDTLAPSARRSYNPTYIQNFSIRPRWYITDSVSLRVREDLNWELTHDDINTNSAQFSDLQVGIQDTGWFTVGGAAVGGGLTLFAPISIASMNCGLITGLTGNVSITKVIPEVLTGLTFQGFGSFRGNLHTDNVCTLDDVYSESQVAGANLGDPNQTGGLSNAYLSGQVGISVGLAPIPELSFFVTWLNQWNLGRPLADACFDDASAPGGMTCIPDLSDSHTRVFALFQAGVTWLTNEWINMSLAYGSFNFALDGSGNVYNPFYNPQSQLLLQAVVILDRAYQGAVEMLDGDDEEEDPSAQARRRARDEEADPENSDEDSVAAISRRRTFQ